MSNPRVLLAAGVALIAVAIVVGVSLTSGGSSGERDRTPRIVRGELTLERFVAPGAAQPELLVSLADPELNTLDVTRGERAVSLRCFDDSGRVAIRRVAEWPLLEEPGFLPHIHQPANRRLLESIRACRLTGPGIELEGQLPAGPPPAAPPAG